MCFRSMKWGSGLVAAITAVAAAAATGATAAHAAPFKDVLVQAPSIGLPQRGSLAGSLSKLSFGAADLARGAYALPLGIEMPSERGAIGTEVFPSYSAEGGLGEYGMGWSVDLSIKRHRVVGELHYDDSDGYTSPWGRLEQGDDGAWYPSGLSAVVRLVPVAGGWEAVTADGTRYLFAAAEATTVADGTYAWQLTEVETVLGDLTTLVWTKNASGRSFLSAVRWGGRHDGTQYEASFTYEDLARPFASYASGTRMLLDRRVKTITAKVKTPGAGFAERWRYDLAYTTSPIGPAFYLTSVTRRFASGEADPPVVYAYDYGAGQLQTAQLTHNPTLDLFLTAAGGAAIQPDRSSMTDLEENGLTDLEHYYAFTTVRRTATGYTFEDLPPRTGGENPLCRPQASTLNKPRLLARMRGNAAEPQVVVVRKNGVGQTTTITLCDRPGFTLSSQTYPGNWELGANVRLADINQDLRPDIVRIQNGAVNVLWNVSTDSTWAFLPGSAQTLSPAISANASWVIDVNGDGKADLMSRTTSGVVVWWGKGTGRFEQTGAPMTFRTLAGVPLTNVAEHQFSHGDFNGDGLTDVILSKGQNAYLYLNQGHQFQQLSVPGIASIPFSFGYPVVGDLTGSGNPEVVFVDGTKARTIALSTPSTGLMTSADDGKGTVVRFGYRRIEPEPGIIHRYALLDSLSVESSGYDPVTFRYAYAAPVWHSLGRYLVGFAETHKRGPFVDEQVDFHHDDSVAGVVVATSATDERTPGIVRFSHHDFEPATFHGVPWRRLLGSDEGYRDATGATPPLATRTDVVAYERDLCPTVTTVTRPGGVLTREETLASPAALPADLACVSASQRLLGAHDDASLDFEYRADIVRDDLGQVTRVVQHGPGAPLVLQDNVYDGSGRLLESSAPGRGATVATYDSLGRIASVTAPDGTVNRVTGFDPLSDAILTLAQERGSAGSLLSYAYDGRGRLAASWNDFTGASAAQPSQRLSYREATLTAPGLITTDVLVDVTAGPAGLRRVKTDVLAADGESKASASWAGAWLISGLRRDSKTELTETGWVRAPIGGHAALAAFTWSDLFAGAQELSRVTRAGFGHETDEETLRQAGVTGAMVTTWQLGAGVLRAESVESGNVVTVSERDAAGRLVRFVDGAGVSHAYAYDALDRLVAVDTPEGLHSVRFDGYGRPARVVREGLATVEYAYDATSGLPVVRRFLDADGAEVRRVTTEHDAIGRAVHHEHRRGDGATRDYWLEYDAPGQLGLLSRVAGAGYERRATYDRGGRMTRLVVGLGDGWRTITSEPRYYADGTLSGSRVRITADDGTVLLDREQRRELDAWGRDRRLLVDGQPVYTLSYDAEGRLASAELADGHTITFAYDPVTHARRGYAIGGPVQEGGVAWQLDARGHVAEEVLSHGPGSRTRAYAYDARGFLVAASDQADGAAYTYDAAGLPVSVTDLAGQRQVKRAGATLSVGGTTYRWDRAGRVVQRGADELVYGPTGDLETAYTATGELGFVYDEAGQRVLKLVDGVPVMAWVAGGVLTTDAFVEPVDVGGILVGYLENGDFRAILADPRGTPLADELGAAYVATPFGVRSTTAALAEAIDFTRFGRDADLGTVRMGVRDYDPMLSQFMTPDPLYLESLAKCQGSPVECNLFSYAGNNPISFVDPSGMDRKNPLKAGPGEFVVVTRSYAPFKEFGGGFAGDNRGASIDRSATARITQETVINGIDGKARTSIWSDPSHAVTTWGRVKSAVLGFDGDGVETSDPSGYAKVDELSGGGLVLRQHYEGDMPLIKWPIPAPNIDVYSDVTFIYEGESKTLRIYGKMRGDAFPNAEMFLEDSKGNAIMLSHFVTGGSAGWGPHRFLPDDTQRRMTEFDVSVKLDKDANFQVKDGKIQWEHSGKYWVYK